MNKMDMEDLNEVLIHANGGEQSRRLVISDVVLGRPVCDRRRHLCSASDTENALLSTLKRFKLTQTPSNLIRSQDRVRRVAFHLRPGVDPFSLD